MKTISVDKIINTDEELKAFPIEASIDIYLTENVDTSYLSDYVYLLLLNPNAPSINSTNPEILSSNYQDSYTNVVCEFSTAQESDKTKLSITPETSLVPGRKYSLVISKNLPPKYYSVLKTNSYGNSSLSFVPKKEGTLNNEVRYSVVIRKNSLLSKGQHILAYDLEKNGTQITTNRAINISSNFIEVDEGYIKLSPSFPFLENESFLLTLNPHTRLGETVSQTIETFSQDTNYESTSERSSRLNQEDIIKFYERVGLATRTKEQMLSSTGSITVDSKMKAAFRYPNVIELDLGIKIDPNSLTSSSFDISIGYAFGNHLLSQMGLFDPSLKYVISWTLKSNQIIILTIDKDVNGIVPANKSHVVIP